jgi:hypothetical protein
MRRNAKIDANQPEIVAGLAAAGCSVQSLATVGKGCPDLLVGRAGRNFVLEVKDGGKSPSRQRLTEDEQAWHANWRGQVATVRSLEEALAVIQAKEGDHA